MRVFAAAAASLPVLCAHGAPAPQAPAPPQTNPPVVAAAPVRGASLAAAPAAGTCRAIPGTPQWPSEQDWGELRAVLGERLIKPQPPAAVCHQGWPSFNEEQCAKVRTSWGKGSWHTEDPVSSMFQNYNNYSCMPDEGSNCTLSGYPVYVVAAQTASDVKAAVDFARTKNIRLNIKSTGHDFLGRSIQPNSLSIWVHGMKDLDFVNAFVPEGCPRDKAIPGLTAVLGSGVQFKDTKIPTASRKVMLVSGASETVSISGWTMNGGHGRLSAKYGLGADMVAEIELVTADGQIIKANECQNQDYFWAMRGGGGSTFGVATKFAVQTIPTAPVAMWRGELRGWDEIVYSHQQWARLSAAGASAYIGGDAGKPDSFTIDVYLPNATSKRDIEALMEPAMVNMNTVARKKASKASGKSSTALPKTNATQPQTQPALPDADRTAILRDTDHTVSLQPPAVRTDERPANQAPALTKRERQLGAAILARGKSSWYSTYAEAQDEMSAHSRAGQLALKNESFPGTGSSKIIASWMWNAQVLKHPDVGKVLREAFKHNDTQFLTDLTMGVGTWTTPYMRGAGNAVNPAFRTATMRPAAEFNWYGVDAAKRAEYEARALKAGEALRSLDRTSGTYANEGDPNDPNWQHSFWGSNYPRLLELKRRLDPQGVFYCRACVGSELWVDNEGVLCRK